MKLVLCRVQTRPLPLVSGTRYICKLILTGEQGGEVSRQSGGVGNNDRLKTRPSGRISHRSG